MAPIAIECANAEAVSRALWRTHQVQSRASGACRLCTYGVERPEQDRAIARRILESYWRESYVELLWLSTRARRAGLGSKLLKEAERLARLHGSRMIHLNTFSIQAPGFYERHGYRRFGRLSGSPAGESRHYFVKRLRRSDALRRG